ncbi:MAG: CcmD family protein [Pedobacter sp.]|jgi:protein-S-isoprenylcysteine O-methyltransferase Ste14|nr:MAG: CcmD family protein [Pedobacter sp.]
MKKIILAIFLVINTITVFAQDNGIEMADTLRSNGKIYVVVVCIVIILIGLILYLFAMDRRLKKLENK